MPSVTQRPAQIERHWKFAHHFVAWHEDSSGRMAMIFETRQAPRFGLIGIDRKGLVIAAARMRDMIDAAAESAAVPECR